MKVVIALVTCLLLTACASSRWVNPSKPGTDPQSDLVQCEKDAERLVKLGDLAQPPSTMDTCAAGPNCQGRDIQRVTEAQSALKRCMAKKGWQQQ